MANYLFLRGNRNKKFFINIAKELSKLGHRSYLMKFELGDLLFKSEGIETVFAPFKISKREYPISDEDILAMPIYNITYTERILKKKVPSKFYRTFKRYMYFIDQYIEQNKIDCICIFNGYHWIDQIAKFLAEKRGLKLFFFEDGLFRPFTVTCDPKGINAVSSVTQNPSFYDSIDVDYDRLEKYLFKPETPLLLKNKKENLLKVGIVKSFSMFGSFIRLHPNYYVHINFWQAIKYFLFKINYSRRSNDSLELPEEFVFVPFQVTRDTQIFYNSPRIKNMEEFLDYVYDAVQKFNDKNGRNLKIVVKEHPEDMSRNNYKELKNKYKNRKNVIFVEKYNVKKLIKESLGVITINSTVGIEALALNNRVITLGEALYNIDGIVHKCTDPSQLDKILEMSLNHPINLERIQKFIYYLRFHYQVEGNISIPNEQTAKNIANRINI
jgi:capsular polysaccharide export protein